jgi:chemotaxis protein methyltransferase CheR
LSPHVPPDPSAVPAEHGLTEHEFELLSALVAANTGIALGPAKRALLQGRLGKRLRALGLTSFLDYYRVLTERDPDGEELVRFINAVTTNKTEFFREAHHFAYLRDRWVPALRARVAEGAERVVRIWSAGCSSGEEPFSVAMTVVDALDGGWDLKILASDIDTDMLQRGEAATYSLEDVAAVPPPTLHRHFLRGTGAKNGLVQVRPSLRGLVIFRRINLLADAWPIRTRFDIILCRNVLIYFDPPTQARVLGRLLDFLKDDGLLILGHSEAVHGIVEGLRHVGTTIYQKEIDHAGHHPDR